MLGLCANQHAIKTNHTWQSNTSASGNPVPYCHPSLFALLCSFSYNSEPQRSLGHHQAPVCLVMMLLSPPPSRRSFSGRHPRSTACHLLVTKNRAVTSRHTKLPPATFDQRRTERQRGSNGREMSRSPMKHCAAILPNVSPTREAQKRGLGRI